MEDFGVFEYLNIDASHVAGVSSLKPNAAYNLWKFCLGAPQKQSIPS